MDVEVVTVHVRMWLKRKMHTSTKISCKTVFHHIEQMLLARWNSIPPKKMPSKKRNVHDVVPVGVSTRSLDWGALGSRKGPVR